MSIPALRLYLVWMMLLLAIGPATSQQCVDVEVGVGADINRCLQPGAGERFKDCPDCPEMVVVPAGHFVMGSPPEEPERDGEREDQVRVTIAKSFAIGAFAVTRGEFAIFVEATGCKLDEGGPTGTWRQRTVRVDSFRPNAWDLYNVHGNVWDWTDDCWNETNLGNPGDGSVRTTGECTWRVARGGAWNYGPNFPRSAFRYWNLPHNRSGVQGMRVARSRTSAEYFGDVF